jgi:transcriptional regulator with XRE-family HTH domain
LPERTQKTPELALFGAATRELREQRGMSRSELAAALGVSERRVQALEAGRVEPDYVLLVRLAKALGVRAGALLIRADELAEAEPPPTDTPG